MRAEIGKGVHTSSSGAVDSGPLPQPRVPDWLGHPAHHPLAWHLQRRVRPLFQFLLWIFVDGVWTNDGLFVRSRKCSDPAAKQRQLEADLHLTNLSLKQNPKNYSAWEHRKWVLVTMPDADWNMEMGMVDLYLKKDARNCESPPPPQPRHPFPLRRSSSFHSVHSWNYRRWLITQILALDPSIPHPKLSKLPTAASELAFTREKISENFSNFSAWHYRTKLLPKLWSETGWGEESPERAETVDQGPSRLRGLRLRSRRGH